MKLSVCVPSKELMEVDTGQKSIVLDIEPEKIVFSIVSHYSSSARKRPYQFPTQFINHITHSCTILNIPERRDVLGIHPAALCSFTILGRSDSK